MQSRLKNEALKRKVRRQERCIYRLHYALSRCYDATAPNVRLNRKRLRQIVEEALDG